MIKTVILINFDFDIDPLSISSFFLCFHNIKTDRGFPLVVCPPIVLSLRIVAPIRSGIDRPCIDL